MQNSNNMMRPAYTLVELMIGVTLSLLLLIGVTDMFRNIGDTINETQATLNMAQNLNNVALQLRQDLGGIDNDLAQKPKDLVDGNPNSAEGYLEIIEGQGAPPRVVHGSTNITNTSLKTFWDSLTPAEREKYSRTSLTEHTPGRHIPPYWTAYSPDSPTGDVTVSDVDDILAFTTTGTFRGLVNGYNNNPVELTNAEVIWFLRGTNLYRRVLLIPDSDSHAITLGVPRKANGKPDLSGYANQDIAVRNNGTNWELAKLTDLDRRENRFGRQITGNNFPFPLHSDSTNSGWYYLRMPTLEETVFSTWPGVQALDAASLGWTSNGMAISGFPNAGSWGTAQQGQYWDFWENPNGWSSLDPQTGSLSTYVSTPRNPRAGEDIIMSNVIGFDVKVWNPYWVPCGTGNNANEWAPPQYIDLGQDQLLCQDNAVRAVNYAFQFNNGANVNARVPAGIPTDKVGYGFVLKGCYNTTTGVQRTNADGTDNEWYRADRIRDNNGTPANLADDTYATHSGTAMSCVFDSWSADYVNVADADNDGFHDITGLATNLFADPPYTERLWGIQITIRCFEPQSGAIKQIRVVRSFSN